MCGRYLIEKYDPTIFADERGEFFDHHGRTAPKPDLEELFSPRYNIAPTQAAPIVFQTAARAPRTTAAPNLR